MKNNEKKEGQLILPEGRRPDLFDLVLRLPLLKRLNPFYQKHREGLLYLFFGGVTTLVNWLFFWLFGENVLGLHELLANLLAWVIAVAVAFVTNRSLVFMAEGGSLPRQILSFLSGRVLTLLLEEGILAVFVTWLALPEMPVKIVTGVLVVLANYVLSKIWIFKKEKSD